MVMDFWWSILLLLSVYLIPILKLSRNIRLLGKISLPLVCNEAADHIEVDLGLQYKHSNLDVEECMSTRRARPDLTQQRDPLFSRTITPNYDVYLS